jgi:hypothetical protein
MRIATADRVDVNGVSAREESSGPQTVADLELADVRAVATSLSLPSLLVSALTLRPAQYGMVSGELGVALLEIATLRPRWTVSCTEVMYGVRETSNRLANCAGNGVLAVLAPENLIGRAP